MVMNAGEPLQLQHKDDKGVQPKGLRQDVVVNGAHLYAFIYLPIFPKLDPKIYRNFWSLSRTHHSGTTGAPACPRLVSILLAILLFLSDNQS